MHSGPCQISKMELEKMLTAKKMLTNFAKGSIIDNRRGSEYTSECNNIKFNKKLSPEVVLKIVLEILQVLRSQNKVIKIFFGTLFITTFKYF